MHLSHLAAQRARELQEVVTQGQRVVDRGGIVDDGEVVRHHEALIARELASEPAPGPVRRSGEVPWAPLRPG